MSICLSQSLDPFPLFLLLGLSKAPFCMSVHREQLLVDDRKVITHLLDLLERDIALTVDSYDLQEVLQGDVTQGNATCDALVALDVRGSVGMRTANIQLLALCRRQSDPSLDKLEAGVALRAGTTHSSEELMQHGTADDSGKAVADRHVAATTRNICSRKDSHGALALHRFMSRCIGQRCL
jgi:hypothetical protein